MASALHAQAVNKKVLILPVDVSGILKDYQTIQISNTAHMIFEGIYDFIGLLPFVDIPAAGELKRIKSPDIDALAQKYSADIIIYSELRFSGPSSEPVAGINIRIWSRDAKKEIFNKKYNTAIDLDIFDAMDRIIIDSIAASFKIAPRFAVVNLSDFEIVGDKYELYVNNKLIDIVEDSAYNRSLKILADNKYNFMMIRKSDEVVVFNHNITLKQNSVTTINYKGAATVVMNPLKGAEPGKKYQILVDGEVVREGGELKGLPLTINHTLIVMSEDNRILYKSEFKLADGELRHLTADLRGRRLSFRIYALGTSFGGAGLDWALSRKLWLGLDAGYSRAVNTNLNVSVSVLSSYLDLGYSLIGDNNQDIRISPVVGAGMYFALPRDNWSLISTSPNRGVLARAYVQAQWKWYYLRVGAVLDFHSVLQAAPLVSFGLKF